MWNFVSKIAGVLVIVSVFVFCQMGCLWPETSPAPVEEENSGGDTSQSEIGEVEDPAIGGVDIEDEELKDEDEDLFRPNNEELKVDTDEDGIPDNSDNCPDIENKGQSDKDNDGFGDVCDDDRDGDGVTNDKDNCPDVANPPQTDSDNDGMGNLCDPDNDMDGDGVADEADNCPETANVDQSDLDGDSLGDVCDTDDDDDGVDDNDDNCPSVANADQKDENGVSGGDVCDSQIDGIVTSAVRMSLAGGDILGAVDKARILNPRGISLVVKDRKKFLYIGDYIGYHVDKAVLNDNDGTVEAVENSYDFNHYPTGLATMPNQHGIIGLSYYFQEKKGIYSRVGLIKLGADGASTGVTLPFRNPDGTEIKYNISSEYRLVYSVNPVVSSDSSYVYVPWEARGKKPDGSRLSSKIDCFRIDPNTGAVLENPVALIAEPLNIPAGLAFAQVAVNNGVENRLYIADRSSTKLYLLKVNGCRVADGAKLETVVEDKKNNIYIPEGIVISPDGSRLYFTSTSAKTAAIMAMGLNPETGLAKGTPNVIAGSMDDLGFKDGGFTESRLYYPKALALDYDSKRLYVADSENSTVKLVKLTADGLGASEVKNLVGSVTLNPKEEGIISRVINSFRSVAGLAASPPKDGVINIYASSEIAHTITNFKYNVKKGEVVSGSLLAGTPYKIGKSSNAPFSFNAPYGLAFSNPPNLETEMWYLYVADRENDSLRCVRLDALSGGVGDGGVIEVVSSIENKVRKPVDVAVSDNGKYVYMSNSYNFTNAPDGGVISYIEADPGNMCLAVTDSAEVIEETFKTGVHLGSISFYKNEVNGQEKWYIYYAVRDGGEFGVKRIELNPATGNAKDGASPEFIAGSGQAGDPGINENPRKMRFRYPWGIAFSPDRKHMYVTDNSNRVELDIELNDDGTARFFHRLRIVGGRSNPYGSIDGIRTEASFTSPHAVITLPIGDNGISLWVSETYSNAIRQIR